MNKKSITGMGIIISLILVVLIIFLLSGLLFDKAAIFNKNIYSCEGKGGKCVAKAECYGSITQFKCEKENLICCINTD
jgi:hypothetical protein